MAHPKNQPLTHRAREILTRVSQAYPAAWQQVDRLRDARGKELPQWPDWCFLPLRHAQAIVTRGGRQPLSHEPPFHRGILCALATWRVTQGIYRFDPALYEAVINTPLDRDLPHDPLYRLPEWCVYVETPHQMLQLHLKEPVRVHGVWAHLDLEALDGAPEAELRLVLDTARTPSDALEPIYGCLPIPLIGKGTIADSLERMIMLGAEGTRSLGMELPDAKRVAPMLWPIVSLLLYICTESGEIGDGVRRPENPQPKRTRRGWRLFATESPTTWDVGVRIGSAFRRAYQQETSVDAINTGRHVRPHIRVAHWHTFLAGPDRAERRVKWLPVIPVNMRDPDLLPATVRPVE
jgi:hypothetical protein